MGELFALRFELEWSVMEFKQSHFIVCEDAGTMGITVYRRGSLNGSAFVDIRTKEKSAKQGLDYSPSEITQLQFDPGKQRIKDQWYRHDRESPDGWKEKWSSTFVKYPQLLVLVRVPFALSIPPSRKLSPLSGTGKEEMSRANYHVATKSFPVIHWRIMLFPITKGGETWTHAEN